MQTNKNIFLELLFTAETGSEWAGRVFRHFPVLTSHIRTLSSNCQHEPHHSITKWQTLCHIYFYSFKKLFICLFTYRSRNNKVRLWVEVTTEDVVAMAFQCLQTFSLQKHETIRVSNFRNWYGWHLQHQIKLSDKFYRTHIPDLQCFVIWCRHQKIWIWRPGHIWYSL